MPLAVLALTTQAFAQQDANPYGGKEPGGAPAETVPPPPAAPPMSEKEQKLAEAKDLFRQGVTLFGAGDMERALDLFLRSRAAYPSAKNTTNAAICLDKLGRYDEALELYEEVLVKFAADLDESDRTAIAPAMTALRAKVGSIDISANVEGAAVLIDARARGRLPLTTPIRVIGGSRLLRIVKSGYVTFEKTVDVKPGETVKVDAKLEPLAATGLLRVEDPENPGSEVFVDRVLVGPAPWEGTLGPGTHVVWTRKGDVGSAPMGAIVVQGQAALIRARSLPLGPLTRIEVEPNTAHVVIDAVDLGPGNWEGRLPAGNHSVLVREEGYHKQTRSLTTQTGGAKPASLRIQLAIDPNHPRWPKAAAGEISVEAFVGFAFAPGLGSEAEESCPDACSDSPAALGFLAGARAGYRFPFKVAAELSAGYLLLKSSFTRTETSGWPIVLPQYSATYELHDEITLQGPFAMASASYRIGDRYALVPRLGVGVLFAAARDPVQGTASAGGETLPVFVEGAGETVRSAAVFVQPELAGDMRFGSFRVGLALGLSYFLVDGPNFPHGQAVQQVPNPPTTDCSVPGNEGMISCAQQSNVVREERAYGRFFMLSSQLTAAYVF